MLSLRNSLVSIESALQRVVDCRLGLAEGLSIAV